MNSKKKIKKKSNNSRVTTIKLLDETKLRVEKLREHKKESYDDLLRKILYILNLVRDEPEKAKKVLEKISYLREQVEQKEREQKEDLEKEKKGD